MKKILLSAFVVASCLTSFAQATETFHSFEAETLIGDTISMSQYAGKKLLVVNTASFCAYTPQYEALEELDSLYESYNFEVIGFPCNNFGNQEPGSNQDILEFCTGTYGVSFQMMARVEITSADTSEIYKWLQLEERNGVDDANVTWNFHKFCIDEYGHWVMHFPQQTQPDNQEIIDWIMSETPISVNETSNSPAFSVRNLYQEQSISVKLNENWNEKGSVLLYSSDGRQVASINAELLSNTNDYRFDTSALTNGVYFVQARSNTKMHSERVCILK
jgi:glutathione peroxidase